MHLTHELILCTQISRKKVDINKDSAVISPCLHQVFESATFQPRSSLHCSRTFLKRLCHFHGSTRSGPIQVVSTLGDHFVVVTSKLSGMQSILSQSLWRCLLPICWLTCSRYGVPIGFTILEKTLAVCHRTTCLLVKRRLGHREKWLIIEIGTLSTDKNIPHNSILYDKSHAFLLQVTFTKNVP